MGMLDDMAQLLTDAGWLGDATDWPLTIGWMPPDPDKMVMLGQYGGNPPTGRTGRDEPGFQLRIRSDPSTGADGVTGAYIAAEDRLQAMRAYLHNPALWPREINGARYLWAQAQQSIMPLGVDANGRHEFVANFIVAQSRTA